LSYEKELMDYIAKDVAKDSAYQFVRDAENRIDDIISKDFSILTSSTQSLNMDVKALDKNVDEKISALDDKVSKLDRKVDVDFRLAKASALPVFTFLAMCQTRAFVSIFPPISNRSKRSIKETRRILRYVDGVFQYARR